jgi:hypothetical protein
MIKLPYLNRDNSLEAEGKLINGTSQKGFAAEVLASRGRFGAVAVLRMNVESSAVNAGGTLEA